MDAADGAVEPYKYAAISSATWVLTPRSGIAEPGAIVCGSRSHRTRLAGVLGSTPARYFRSERSLSGGGNMGIGANHAGDDVATGAAVLLKGSTPIFSIADPHTGYGQQARIIAAGEC